jgi:hypothetical protein
MNLPGFTAEISLFRMSERYQETVAHEHFNPNTIQAASCEDDCFRDCLTLGISKTACRSYCKKECAPDCGPCVSPGRYQNCPTQPCWHCGPCGGPNWTATCWYGGQVYRDVHCPV